MDPAPWTGPRIPHWTLSTTMCSAAGPAVQAMVSTTFQRVQIHDALAEEKKIKWSGRRPGSLSQQQWVRVRVQQLQGMIQDLLDALHTTQVFLEGHALETAAAPANKPKPNHGVA